MNGEAPLAEPLDRQVFAWGNRLLLLGFGLALSILLYLAAVAPEALPFMAVAVIAFPAVVVLFRRPRLNLLLVLSSFVLITDYEAGIQVREVLYGLYYIAFMVHWLVRTVYLERQRILTNTTDWALALFLAWAGLSASWALFLGATPAAIIGEALVLMMLGMYFPVRHACRTDRSTYAILLLAGAWLALYTTARNLLFYRAALSDATHLWQIATGRVALNESLVMFPALVALCLILYMNRWWIRGVMLAMLATFTGALIATQSRGYWVAFMMGALLLVLLVDRRRKMQFLVIGAGSTVAFVVFALLLFPDVLSIIVAGIADRFMTLGTALSSDISLLSRYYETRALLGEAALNPIVGYGMGTPFRFFDVITDMNRFDAYTHNMYAGTLFKFGLIGLGLVLYFWLSTITKALRLFRETDMPVLLRLTGLIAVVCLSAELIVANTSSPLLISDASLAIALLAGAVQGGRDLGLSSDAGPAAHDAA